MKNSITKRVIIISIWIAIWAILSRLINNSIVLTGPVGVMKSLVENMFTRDFFVICINSSLKIISGFLVSLLAGMILGSIGSRSDNFRDFLSPAVNVIKVVPVASFVVLLLIWAGADALSFYISLLIVFPHIYIATISGIQSADKRILSMAEDYQYSMKNKIIYIYKDSTLPYIISAVRVSFGMAWKSGVAAEVIGMASHTLGERIYMSKIYLDTSGLFSWTIVVVILSYIFERICLWALCSVLEYKPAPKRIRHRSNFSEALFRDIIIDNINAGYGDEIVLKNISISLHKNTVYLLTGESGIGKTTLLNEIAKRMDCKASWVYQELRLLDKYSVITNVMLSAPNMAESECIEVCSTLLPKEALNKKVSELSGGMKQRVALIKALMYDGEILLLDEPFSGLDDDNRKKSIQFIEKYRNKRTVILVSHDDRDEMLIDAKKIVLDEKGLHQSL